MNGTLITAGGSASGKACDLILAAFAAALPIPDIAATKILVLGPFSLDEGIGHNPVPAERAGMNNTVAPKSP